MNFLKRTLPLVIAFAVGVVMALREYVPNQASQDLLTTLTNWAKIVGGFALLLGLYSLLHMHALRIKRRIAGWGYSGLVYLGLGVTVLFGLLMEFQIGIGVLSGGFWNPDITSWSVTMVGEKEWPTGSPGPAYDWTTSWIFNQCGATVFSILAFFIASAAFRTFVARTWEAAILLAAAIIVMLGAVPLGGLLSEHIPWLSDRIMDTPNLAAKRGILLGVSLGAISTALRIIFGIERAYLGGGK